MKCTYCGATLSEDELLAHLVDAHEPEELSRIDRRRIEAYEQANTGADRLPDLPVSRRGALATVGILGVTAGFSTGVLASATEIEDWHDLDHVRDDLHGEYVLVNDLDAETDGYDEVVADNMTNEFTETPFVSEEDTAVELTRTPLDTVEATTVGDGEEVDVSIKDADDGIVEFNETVEGTIIFEYSTTDEKFVGFEPIGELGTSFTGSFDGNGHKIADLIIESEDNVGLFGVTGQDATIENVELINAEVTGNEDVGGLVGSNSGTVETSNVTGEVEGDLRVGGLVAANFGSVSNSSSQVSTEGNAIVGGLVGNQAGDVRNSDATGSVEGKNTVGGLAGVIVGVQQADGTVIESTASGTVTGDLRVGGLVGRNNAGTVKKSSANAEVNGKEKVGGLVGGNSGSVSDDTPQVPKVENSFATGEVTGEEDVGGLVGFNMGGSSTDAIVEDSYWDESESGLEDGVGDNDDTVENIEGLLTDEMQGDSAEANMEAFDFAETWETIPGEYPELQRQLDDPPEDPDPPEGSAVGVAGDNTTITNTTVTTDDEDE